MTTEEAVKLATLAGYTQIQSAVGWMPLREWLPCGWHKFDFCVDERNSRIYEQSGGAAAVTGIWPLR